MGIICPIHQPPDLTLKCLIWWWCLHLQWSFVFSCFYLFLMREPLVKEHQGASWGKRWNWVIKKVNATNSAHCAAIIKHLEVIKGSSPKNTSFLGITWIRGRGLESVSLKGDQFWSYWQQSDPLGPIWIIHRIMVFHQGGKGKSSLKGLHGRDLRYTKNNLIISSEEDFPKKVNTSNTAPASSSKLGWLQRSTPSTYQSCARTSTKTKTSSSNLGWLQRSTPSTYQPCARTSGRLDKKKNGAIRTH